MIVLRDTTDAAYAVFCTASGDIFPLHDEYFAEVLPVTIVEETTFVTRIYHQLCMRRDITVLPPHVPAQITEEILDRRTFEFEFPVLGCAIGVKCRTAAGVLMTCRQGFCVSLHSRVGGSQHIALRLACLDILLYHIRRKIRNRQRYV